MSDQSPDETAWRRTLPVVGTPVTADPEPSPPDPSRGPEWIPAGPQTATAPPTFQSPPPPAGPPAPPFQSPPPPAAAPAAAVAIAAAEAPAVADPPEVVAPPSHLRSVVEWVVVGGSALLLALLIRAVLFQTFFIPSASMTPTLRIHDRILVNKLAYDFHSVHRGDIVVFKRSTLHGIPNDEIKNLVKRVIGLPGETVQTTPDGRVEINGTVLPETYLPRGTFSTGIAPTVIPAHHYWVMGDNRSNSADSRVFGPIDKNLIVGRAFVLIWPLPDLGLL